MSKRGATAELLHSAAAENCKDTINICEKPKNNKGVTFGSVAPLLHNLGYSPIPCMGKRPVVSEWTKGAQNRDQLDAWADQFPAHNVGIVNVPALDVDSYHPGVVEEFLTDLRWCYGLTMHRIGQEPKVALPFRCDDPGRKIISRAFIDPSHPEKVHRLEVLAPGQQQWIAFGIHPGTGLPYEWHGGTPLDIRREDLPALSAEQIPEIVRIFEDACLNHGLVPKDREATVEGLEGEQRREVALPLAPTPTDAKTPIDAYNLHGQDHFRAALLDLGWRPCGHGSIDADGGKVVAERFTRPGKEEGVSASLFRAPNKGIWLFHLWSTSVDKLDAANYQISYALKHLAYDGSDRDLLAAIKAAGFTGSDGGDEFADLGTQNPTPDLRPLNIGAALTMVPTKREFVVEQYLPTGIIAALSGTGGQGKSYLALILATAIAAGKDISPFTIKNPGPVLLVSVEDDSADLASRLYTIGQECQLSAMEQADLEKNLFIYPARGRVGPLMEFDSRGNPRPAPGSEWLRERIAEHKPTLVILDTKSRLFGLEENSNDHASRWVSNLEGMLADHPGCTILVINHTGKGSVGSADQHSARGASAFVDNVRAVLTLVPADDAEVKRLRAGDVGPVIKLTHAKASYSVAAPVVFFSKNPIGVPVHLPGLEGSRLRDMALEMLVKGLKESFPNGGNRRNLERGADDEGMLKDLICTEFALDKAMWSGVIQHGLDSGVLETFRDESSKSKNKPVRIRVA